MENDNNNSNNNESKWDKNLIVGVIAIVVGAVVTIATPELRKFFYLERERSESPSPSLPVPQLEPKKLQPKPETQPTESAGVQQAPAAHEAVKEPIGPQEYTLGENKSELIQEAKTKLSVAFRNIGGKEIARVTITPDVNEQIILPTVGIGSKEVSSSTGVFLVQILNVDWDSRTVTVQVSRKS